MLGDKNGQNDIHIDVPDLTLLDLEVTNERISKELQAMKKKCDSLQGENASLSQKLLENQAHLERLSAAEAKLNAVQELEGILENAMLELNFLQTKCDSLETEKKKLQEDAGQIRQDFGSFDSERKKLHDEAELLKKERDILKIEKKAMAEQLQASSKKAEVLAGQLLESSKKADALAEQLKESSKKVDTMAAQLNDKTKRIETLVGQLSESANRIEALTASLEEEKKKPKLLSSPEPAKPAGGESGKADEPAHSEEHAVPRKMRKLFELVAEEDEKESAPSEKKDKRAKARKYVLVVHSDPVVSHGLNTLLRNEGISAVMAESGENALRLIDSQSFAAIIMDINATSDGMTGAYLFKSIQKKNPSLSDLMIFASREEPHSSFLSFLKTTSNRFFANPLENAELIQYLNGL
jgi:CheY-like chemotaxis protein